MRRKKSTPQGRARNRAFAFERNTAKKLSLWWTDGDSDNIFYKTDGSGSRATARHKSGKKTPYQYGDIGANDPIGYPLLNLITFSLKKGYRDTSVADLLDRGRHKNREMESWILKARADAKAAGSKTWMIIHNRGGLHKTYVLFPRQELSLTLAGVSSIFVMEIRIKTRRNKYKTFDLWAITLDTLLSKDPELFGKE